MSEFVVSIETPEENSITGFYPIGIDVARSIEDARKLVLRPSTSVKKMLTKGKVITARYGGEFGTAYVAARSDRGTVKEISDNTIPAPKFINHITSEPMPKYGWWKKVSNMGDYGTAVDIVDSLPIGYRQLRFDAIKRIIRECMYKIMDSHRIEICEEMLISTEAAFASFDPPTVLDLLIRSAYTSNDDYVLKRTLSYARELPILALRIVEKEEKKVGQRAWWAISQIDPMDDKKFKEYENALSSVGKILYETIPPAEIGLAAMLNSKGI